MTYARLKKLITKGAYEKEDMLNKLDVFLMANRITRFNASQKPGMEIPIMDSTMHILSSRPLR